MNILNEITNLLPIRKGSLFDEKHIGKGEALCCALEKGITECRKFECEMFCWKLYLLFIISSIIMTYILTIIQVQVFHGTAF